MLPTLPVLRVLRVLWMLVSAMPWTITVGAGGRCGRAENAPQQELGRLSDRRREKDPSGDDDTSLGGDTRPQEPHDPSEDGADDPRGLLLLSDRGRELADPRAPILTDDPGDHLTTSAAEATKGARQARSRP